MTTFAAQTKAAEAPDIEPGMYDAKFVGTEAKKVTGGKFQKNPAGDDKLAWKFQLLDDDGDVIREDRDEHPNFGKPIEVEKLTGVGFNIAAKTVPAELLILKALMSGAEYTAFEGGEQTKEEDLIGRVVQVEVFVKDTGWLGVGNVVAARKARGRKATS